MKLALDTALELGIRRGEMCGICIESIDFNLNKIIINKALIRIENKYVKTTSDTYSHVTEKMNRKATDVISNLMQIK